MLLKSTTNRSYWLEIPDKVDTDGEVWVSVDEYGGDCKNIYINREGAIAIIEHLQKIFSLEK